MASPVIDLTQLTEASAGLWFKQAINHYSGEAKEHDLIRMVAFEKGQIDNPNQYYELSFSQVPRGDSWSPVMSEVLAFPDELQNKKVRVGFVYKATADFAPTWQLYEMGVLELPQQNP